MLELSRMQELPIREIAERMGRSDDLSRGRGPALGRSPHRRVPQLSVDSVDVVGVDVLAEKTLQCFSFRTITWSRSSRRALPTHLSAIPFCQGLRNAVRRGSTPIWSIVWVTWSEKIESLSYMRNRGGVSFGECLAELHDP